MGQTSLFLPFLRHVTQIQIDTIINVSFKYRNVKFYRNKKNPVPLRVRASQGVYSDMYMTGGGGARPRHFLGYPNEYQEKSDPKNKFMKIADPKQ